jgi:hypothetical protein
MKLIRKFIFCFSVLLGASLSAANAEFDIYTGDGITAFEPLMQEWCGVHFAPYPYLYAAPKNKIECPPPGIYAQENEAFLMLGKIDGKTVGMLSAIALDSPFLNGLYFPEDTAAQIKERGYDPSEILYIGMFLIDGEHKQNGPLIFSMYDKLAALAKDLGKTKICYIDIIMPEDHPLKPAVVTSPEPWGETIKGFTSMDYTVNLNWNTFQVDGSVKDESHTLLFYIKDL